MTHQLRQSAVAIDQIFADTWLTVARLKRGLPINNGEEFYRQACQQVEQARSRLQDAGYSRTDIEHMLYAQCALLDESVMNRNERDAGYQQWLKSPLQATYFNTLEAGAQLWDRVATVLHDNSASQAVLVCFHRVLLLGFSGQHRDSGSQHRLSTLEQLGQRVPAYALTAGSTLTVAATAGFNKRTRYLLGWLIAGAGLLALWWFLSNSLQGLLQQLLS